MNSSETLRINQLQLALQHLGYGVTPVSEADLVHLEGALGVRLPSGYREFLLHIGHNVGPHTMWSPDRILQESLPEESESLEGLRMLLEASDSLEELRSYLGVDNVKEIQEFQKLLSEAKSQHPGLPQPSRSFPFTRTQAEAYNLSVPEESNLPWLFGLYPADGSIPIADSGDVFFYVLAVTGDAVGSVWEVTGEFQTSWRPARRPPGVRSKWSSGHNPLPALSAPPTFLEWYCSWIEQLLVDLCADPGGYLNLALMYQHMGEYSAAVEKWDKAIQMTPGNSLAYYYRGLAFKGLQQMAEAEADFKRCRSRSPDPWTRTRAEEQLG